jgi:hypothetical protein
VSNSPTPDDNPTDDDTPTAATLRDATGTVTEATNSAATKPADAPTDIATRPDL